jgi:ATP-dependent DNA helicase RecG
VRDADHKIVGTTFRPLTDKVKGQEIENWLATQLHPSIHFRIDEGTVDGAPVAVFEVPAASDTPVRFRDFEYIRVDRTRRS